jgi:hypothetical protein
VKRQLLALGLLAALDACSLVLGLDDAEFDPAMEGAASKHSAGAGADEGSGTGGAGDDAKTDSEKSAETAGAGA